MSKLKNKYMTTEQQVLQLKNAAGMLAMFKASTDGIDAVISDLSEEDFHTPKQYSEEQFDGANHSAGELSE